MLFNCDRCRKKIEGDETAHFTSGFYYVNPGSCWEKYARPYETIVCDECMFADPLYQADYY